MGTILPTPSTLTDWTAQVRIRGHIDRAVGNLGG
jgi:hypothetical protein